jgi:hypothetical protein
MPGGHGLLLLGGARMDNLRIKDAMITDCGMKQVELSSAGWVGESAEFAR